MRRSKSDGSWTTYEAGAELRRSTGGRIRLSYSPIGRCFTAEVLRLPGKLRAFSREYTWSDAMSWERDPLWAKARLYFEHAFREPRDDPRFGLWCSLGLEL